MQKDGSKDETPPETPPEKPVELIIPSGLPGRTVDRPGFQRRHDINEDSDPFDTDRDRRNVDKNIPDERDKEGRD